MAETARISPRRDPRTGENPWPPLASKCENCRGVFNDNPWQLERNDHCPSCGAVRHWGETPSIRDWYWVPYAREGWEEVRRGRTPAGMTDFDEIKLAVAEAFRHPVVGQVLLEMLRKRSADLTTTSVEEVLQPLTQKDARLLLGLMHSLTPNINYEALAKHTGIPKRSLTWMSSRGAEILAENSPSNNEENQMTNAELVELVRHEHEQTRAHIDEGLNDVFRAIMAFRETRAEDWERHLEKRGNR